MIEKPQHRTFLRRSSLLLALGCLVCSLTCYAAADEAIHNFDVPAQGLAEALQTLGAIADEQVLFSAAVVAGLRSSAVKGELTTDAALSIMLRGTGLRADRTNSG